MDLGEVNGDQDDVSHYAFTLVHSERQQEGYLAFGYGDVLTGDADGGDVAKVWLNGEVVYENHERHGFMLADTTFPRIHARLNRGDNRLLFKIGNVSRDAWMAAHVVNEDGDRLFDIEYVLPSRGPTAVDEEAAGTRPQGLALLQNYPNPFNPSTTIRFEVSQPRPVRLEIFDAAGQRLRTLAQGLYEPGVYEHRWDGRDGAGFSVASGAYISVLRVGDTTQSRMMALVR